MEHLKENAPSILFGGLFMAGIWAGILYFFGHVVSENEFAALLVVNVVFMAFNIFGEKVKDAGRFAYAIYATIIQAPPLFVGIYIGAGYNTAVFLTSLLSFGGFFTFLTFMSKKKKQ